MKNPPHHVVSLPTGGAVDSKYTAGVWRHNLQFTDKYMNMLVQEHPWDDLSSWLDIKINLKWCHRSIPAEGTPQTESILWFMVYFILLWDLFYHVWSSCYCWSLWFIWFHFLYEHFILLLIFVLLLLYIFYNCNYPYLMLLFSYLINVVHYWICSESLVRAVR